MLTDCDICAIIFVSKRYKKCSTRRKNKICNKCNKPTRVAHDTLKDGKKVRVCSKCKENLDK